MSCIVRRLDVFNVRDFFCARDIFAEVMKQSGMPSRRHMPRPGPMRLNKSDGQFSAKNILTNVFSPRVERFTPGTCLSASSRERPIVYNMTCNWGQCPTGYTNIGYDGTKWNGDIGAFCTMRNEVCVKSNYDTNDWKTVANCCNGVTPQKDCDPSLCKNSQACRNKMTSSTWCDNPLNINRSDCVTYLNADGNDDVKTSILTRNCTAAHMAGGICRDYVTSGKAHGQLDNAVMSWCKDKIPMPPPIDPQLTEWAKYRLQGIKAPWINMLIDYTPKIVATPQIAMWNLRYEVALRDAGGHSEALLNPPVVYYDNSKDPICSCILSQLNKTGEKSPPVACFDSACQQSGYQTTGMKAVAANCPSWVECRSNILAASSGVVDNVKVNQVCGEPPPGTYIPPTPTPTPTPMPTSTGGIKDDKTLLKEDEARATGTPTPTIINTTTTRTISQQLAAPFAPSLFGNTSVAEVSILFFAMLILGAILWRSWMNRQATQLIQGQYEAALEYDRQQELADRTREIKESISAMDVK